MSYNNPTGKYPSINDWSAELLHHQHHQQQHQINVKGEPGVEISSNSNTGNYGAQAFLSTVHQADPSLQAQPHNKLASGSSTPTYPPVHSNSNNNFILSSTSGSSTPSAYTAFNYTCTSGPPTPFPASGASTPTHSSSLRNLSSFNFSSLAEKQKQQQHQDGDHISVLGKQINLPLTYSAKRPLEPSLATDYNSYNSTIRESEAQEREGEERKQLEPTKAYKRNSTLKIAAPSDGDVEMNGSPPLSANFCFSAEHRLNSTTPSRWLPSAVQHNKTNETGSKDQPAFSPAFTAAAGQRSSSVIHDSTSTRLNIVRESLIRNQAANLQDEDMDPYNGNACGGKRTPVVSNDDDDDDDDDDDGDHQHEIRSNSGGSGSYLSSSSIMVKPWEGETILQEEACLMEEGLELTLGNSNTCLKAAIDMNTAAADLVVPMNKAFPAAAAMSID
jgi:hypothetical protein